MPTADLPDESTEIRLARQAEETKTATMQDTEQTQQILSEHRRWVGSILQIGEKNHFGENLLKIMQSPARKSSPHVA